MTIEEATGVTPELEAALARLVPQLSPGSPPPDAAWLRALVESPAVTLLLARGDDGAILGTLSLAAFPIPTGLRVWIEDVVVDEAARGRGVGEALVRAALDRARGMGATAVNLTSNPGREAANRLYPRLGFQRRDTNAYRILLG